MSSGVAELIQQGKLDIQHYLDRHLAGDWGDVTPERAQANEHAIHRRDLLFSAYILTPVHKLWIITEADRSLTTLLLIRTVLIQS